MLRARVLSGRNDCSLPSSPQILHGHSIKVLGENPIRWGADFGRHLLQDEKVGKMTSVVLSDLMTRVVKG